MASTNSLSLDLAQAAHHIACLEPEDVPHIFAALPEAPGSIAPPRQYFGRLADVAATFESMQRNGCGVFVTVNAMLGRRRRCSDVSRIRALWVERDGPGAPMPLPPSLVILTSPGRSHEYLLTEPHDALVPAEAHALNRRAATQCSADACATDPARLLRLAGTWNLKRSPCLATIVAATGQRYNAATLRAAFPAVNDDALRGDAGRLVMTRQTVAHQHRLSRSGLVHHPERYLDAVVQRLGAELAAAPQGARNTTLNRVAFRLARLGLDTNAVFAVLGPIAAGIGLGTAEVTATIRSATRSTRS